MALIIKPDRNVCTSAITRSNTRAEARQSQIGNAPVTGLFLNHARAVARQRHCSGYTDSTSCWDLEPAVGAGYVEVQDTGSTAITIC